ncbi:MAG: NTP transferase domain-containing protein [Rhizobiales bacterium]|nr:NTP transferase domain-containing protein [Hyphomicrobiales bacterium]
MESQHLTPSSGLGAVVLAAGLARRMGGPNKLLVEVAGRPLLAHTLSRLADTGFSGEAAARVVVVTGRDAAAVAALVAPFGFRTCHNPAYVDGMGGTIAAGFEALDEACEAAFLVLGDMAATRQATFTALAGAFAASRSGAIAIVAPRADGRLGHPVLFSRRTFAELAALSGDQGARAVRDRDPARLLVIETDDPGIHADVDTAGDLDRMARLIVSRTERR